MASHAPGHLELPARGLSLRARMLVALPAINVVTAVVADAATHRGNGRLTDLALALLVAVAVAGRVSLILTVLLADSITEPIGDLRDAASKGRCSRLAARRSKRNLHQQAEGEGFEPSRRVNPA